MLQLTIRSSFYFTQPIHLEHTDFKFGVMEEGEYIGLPYVGLLATNFEKGTSITLKNVYLEHSDDRFHRLPDDVDDEFSLYKLLVHHLTVNCPPDVGRIFRHPAGQKQLKVSSLSLSVSSRARSPLFSPRSIPLSSPCSVPF